MATQFIKTGIFELSDKEIEKWHNFQKKMNKKYSDKQRDCGAIGGFFEISFIPTGLGNIVIAKTALGDENDITDYDLF